MAIGDDAAATGYLLVPNAGVDGKVRYGAREINRTRDYIAVVKASLPKTKNEARLQAGINYGTGNPTGGANGDVYFKIF